MNYFNHIHIHVHIIRIIYHFNDNLLNVLFLCLKYGEKLSPPGTTLVYPEAIREAVRRRFQEEDTGKHDHQYLDKVILM